jgi:hypothetical protein
MFGTTLQNQPESALNGKGESCFMRFQRVKKSNPSLSGKDDCTDSMTEQVSDTLELS